MEYNYAVMIGRFSPVHPAHIKVIQKALETAEQVIVAIGSSFNATTIKNPWTFEERRLMIGLCLTGQEYARVHFVPVRDYYYNDTVWMEELQERVNQVTNGDESVVLLGAYKDASSYYLNLFPQWDKEITTIVSATNATAVRDAMFGLGKWQKMVPQETLHFLKEYVKTERFDDMVQEWDYIQKYIADWKDTPYPVSFNTGDAVVVRKGHVLVVRRGRHPGKGLLAIPGGFIRQNETYRQCAVRELKEETGIDLKKPILDSYIKEDEVFDYPYRSLRGRVITHAFFIKLPDSLPLPNVKAGDDASEAFWMPISEATSKEMEFFEDHIHILRKFLYRN